LNLLRSEFGITATARPIRKDHKTLGYKFKNAA